MLHQSFPFFIFFSAIDKLHHTTLVNTGFFCVIYLASHAHTPLELKF